MELTSSQAAWVLCKNAHNFNRLRAEHNDFPKHLPCSGLPRLYSSEELRAWIMKTGGISLAGFETRLEGIENSEARREKLLIPRSRTQRKPRVRKPVRRGWKHTEETKARQRAARLAWLARQHRVNESKDLGSGMQLTSAETAWTFGIALGTLTAWRNNHIESFPKGRLHWRTVYYEHDAIRAWLAEHSPERLALFDERVLEIPAQRARREALKTQNPGKKGGRPKKRGVEA